MNTPDLATQRQNAAASPDDSVWLSANAGSGKTKVLTDRVARLLLRGTEPQKILCLTYTKAAAAEMQNRLLRRLGEWAMLPEPDLRRELTKLGIATETLDAATLAEARRLFAKAIEAPGGLKIQTIHSFCASLLRRFPLEAGVPHGFSEMDDRAGLLLRRDLLEELASGQNRDCFDGLAAFYSGAEIERFLGEIISNRSAFPHDLTREAVFQALGARDQSVADLVTQTLTRDDLDLLHSLIEKLARGKSSDIKLASAFASVQTVSEQSLRQLEQVLLYGGGAKNPFGPKLNALPTKDLRESLDPSLVDALNDLMERVAEAREARIALFAAGKTWALHRFAQVFLPLYAARKRARGWLDFDDLIECAGQLLSSPSVAQWVLFRLDGGIDHILVDEAQDTSPGQWRVIEKLADEFTTGESARQATRTIFVVGDRKQSIYSFQGADLHHFEAMQSHFSAKFAAIDRPLRSEALEHSFRSSPAVLSAVDRTFTPDVAGGLGGVPTHAAFFEHAGRVDLWPVVPKTEAQEPEDWETPVDLQAERAEHVILAQAIAEEIAAMIAQGVQLPEKDGSRAVHEGDFLILVQRRKELFNEIIRACKARGLAIAGADKLELGAELAVRDIRSVLAFLATPEDDLALAEALRSPLLGWSEEELFALAHPRKGYLWEALRHDAAHPETVVLLQDLRNNADYLRPYDLIERLLNRHGGREKLLARLGPEAEDGIDELIAQALAFEQNEVPSLTGFLGWLAADKVEVKRQLESGGRAIRVMTVHGSKGLEAPIVILPETAKRKGGYRGEIVPLEGEFAVWKTGKDELPQIVQERLSALQDAQNEERMRLLYVALTRAEKWLIVAGSGDIGTNKDSWYLAFDAAILPDKTETITPCSAALGELGAVRRMSFGVWPADRISDESAGPVARPDLPDWLRQAAPAMERAEKVLSPSDLGGAKALPGENAYLDPEAAMRRGTLLHLLLEHLPEYPAPEWPAMAGPILRASDFRVDLAETETLLAEAERVLTSTTMAEFLVPEALAEVPITASLPELDGARIHGTIDRMVVTPTTIKLLDYKSNATVPQSADEVPLGIVRQMAAYRAALRQIYPAHQIECSILWTADASRTLLTEAQLDVAFCADTAS